MAAGVRVAPPPPTEIFGKCGPGDAVRVAPPPAPAEDLDWNTWSEQLQEWLPTGPCAFRKQWGCKNDIATKVRAGRGFQPRRAARRRAARRAAWVWPRWRWRPRWWPLGLDEQLSHQWNSGLSAMPGLLRHQVRGPNAFLMSRRTVSVGVAAPKIILHASSRLSTRISSEDHFACAHAVVSVLLLGVRRTAHACPGSACFACTRLVHVQTKRHSHGSEFMCLDRATLVFSFM